MELKEFKAYFKKSLEVFEEIFPAATKNKQLDLALDDLFLKVHTPVCSNCGMLVSESEVLCTNCDPYYCDSCGKPSDFLKCSKCVDKIVERTVADKMKEHRNMQADVIHAEKGLLAALKRKYEKE